MRPYKIQLPRGLKAAIDLLTKGSAKNQISEGEQFFITDDTLPVASILRKRVVVGLADADVDKYLPLAIWNDVKGISVNAGYDFTAAKTYGANASNFNIAIGASAIAGNVTDPATAVYSIAIGNSAKANASTSVAIGRLANTDGNSGTAIGAQANANAAQATAIGIQANVTASSSTALGYGATVASTDILTSDSTHGVVSVGSSTFKRRIIQVRDGVNANDAATYGQLSAAAPLYSLKVTGATGGTVVGTEAVKAFGNNNVILGIGGQAGNSATNTQNNCIVIGQGNWVYSDGGIAIGTSAGVYPSCNDSIALGFRSTVQTTDLVGNDTVISIGNDLASSNQYARKRRLINMKAGVNSTDGVNVDQLNKFGIGEVEVAGGGVGAGQVLWMGYTFKRPDGTTAFSLSIPSSIPLPPNYDLRDCNNDQLPRVPTAPMPGYAPPQLVQCKDLTPLYDEIQQLRDGLKETITKCPQTGRYAKRVVIDIGSFTATEAWRTVATWAVGIDNGTNPVVWNGVVNSASADGLSFHVALRNNSNNFQIYPRIALAVTNAKLTYFLSTDEIDAQIKQLIGET